MAVSKTDHMLSIIDPATLGIIRRVPIGSDPHEVVASTDGKTAYVSNTGYGSAHELNIIDLSGRTAPHSFDTWPLLGPHGMTYLDGKLWFTAQGSKAIARYSPDSGRIEWIMGTGQNTTHMMYVSPDGKRICTTNVESGTVSIFEYVLLQPTVPPTGVLPAGAKPHMDWVQTIIPVGKGAEGFDVSPDGKELWTAKPDGRIAIVDVTQQKLMADMDAHIPGAHRLKFTPDGKRVYIVSVKTGDVAVYDAASRKEIKRLQTGRGAAMLMDAVGKRLFISCTPDNYIAIIDLERMEVSGRLDVGGRPDGLGFAGGN